MDEIEPVSRLRSPERPEVRKLMTSIDNRRLYKRVLYSREELSEKERGNLREL